MNERIMRGVEPDCYGNELDLGVVRNPWSPLPKRKKSVVKWPRAFAGAICLALSIACLPLANHAHTDAMQGLWSLLFVIGVCVTLSVIFGDGKKDHRPYRRSWNG